MAGAGAVGYAVAEGYPGRCRPALPSAAPPRDAFRDSGLVRRGGEWASPGRGQGGERAPQRGCRDGEEQPEPVLAGVFLKQCLVYPWL